MSHFIFSRSFSKLSINSSYTTSILSFAGYTPLFRNLERQSTGIGLLEVTCAMRVKLAQSLFGLCLYSSFRVLLEPFCCVAFIVNQVSSIQSDFQR